MGLALTLPVALYLSPSPANLLCDLSMSALIPLHSYYGMSNVVHDYIPAGARGGAMLLVLVLCVLMLLGMLRLTVDGPGVTEAIKRLWRDPAKSAK